MATVLSKKSNYLWWAIFFLGFYITAFVRFFLSESNPVYGIGQSSLLSVAAASLSVPVGLAWLVQIVGALLIAFVLTLPLLLFRFRKGALGLVALVFIAELVVLFLEISKTDDGSGLYLLLLPIFVGYSIAGYLGLVGVPVLIQKKVNLDATAGEVVGIAIIVLGVIAALFLTALSAFTSFLATGLPVSKAAQATQAEHTTCERMEQVSQYASPWREYFRDHCPLGVGEQLPFPAITEAQFQQAAQSCNVERYFLTKSGFAGLCLRDRTGYLVDRGSERYDQLQKTYQENHIPADFSKPERPECDFLAIDFRFGDPEETYLQEMQKLCTVPATNP